MSTNSECAIKIEGLGKRYRLGRDHADSLRDLLSGSIRTALRRSTTLETENHRDFWALRDVSFDVEVGEVFGVIGKNGAGKSTLLKLLSRITEPTCGQIELMGRIASLLEVGTGFHPDLTGLENIYMNAGLLGMARKEVSRKLDQIVEFSGVSAFLDTPVKRYSSGMRVRLGFAVAAHLEPDILIIDEVLTVGDAEFQKKCLGKMQSVATEGRTVIFVSHNMSAVRALCQRSCFLQDGRLIAIGDTDAIAHAYLSASGHQAGSIKHFVDNTPIVFGGVDTLHLLSFKVAVADETFRNVITTDQAIEFEFQLVPLRSLKGFRAGMLVKCEDGTAVFGTNTPLDGFDSSSVGKCSVIRCTLPGHILNRGNYLVDIGIDYPVGGTESFSDYEAVRFEIADIEGHGTASEPLPGIVRPQLRWQLDVGPSGENR